MIRSFARTLILTIAGLALILLVGMCSSRVGAQGPALVTFLSRTQTADRVTYDYAVTATGTVTSVAIDGPCLLDSGGLIVRYNGSDHLTYLDTGFARSLDGAKIAIRYAPTVYTVIGVWVSAEYPGGLLENSRWAMFPLWAYTEGNPTPYEQIVPQCDQSPTVLPLITAGPSQPGFTISVIVVIVLILILHSNRRPTPPMLFEEVQDGTESRVSCDCCDETWEKEFFCPNCSHRIQVRQELVPNLMWDGLPSDAMVWEDVHDLVGNICFNCCTCYYRRPPGPHSNTRSTP